MHTICIPLKSAVHTLYTPCFLATAGFPLYVCSMIIPKKKRKFIKQNIMKKNVFLLILSLIIIMSSCKKDEEDVSPDPKPQPEETIVVADETKVVDMQTRQLIEAMDTTNFTFTFTGNNEFSDNLAVGDILVDSTSPEAPFGYLRKVSHIEDTKGQVIVQTEQASITEAVHKGTINFRSGQVEKSRITNMKLAEGVRFINNKSTDFTVFEFEYEHTFENENGSFTLSGHTQLDMEFFFDFDWDWELLPYPRAFVKKFESGVEVTQSAQIQMYSEAGMGIKEEFPLAEFYFTPWTFMLGPVPVVFLPRVQLFVKADGSITAELTAMASENINGKMGVRYKDEGGWSTINEMSGGNDFTAPRLNANCDFAAMTGPRIDLLLYGVAGPYAYVAATANLYGYLYSDQQLWDLFFEIGVKANVGVSVDLIGFNRSWGNDIEIYKKELLHFEQQAFEDAIYLTNPTNDMQWLIGNELKITTEYTGTTPDWVMFKLNGVMIGTDTEEPFEWNLNTDDFSEGDIEIRVSAIIGDVPYSSDVANVHLREVRWSSIDLSSLGIDEATRITDAQILSGSDLWLSTSNNGQGKLLKSDDGGYNWEVLTNMNMGLEQIVMQNEQDGIFLTGTQEVYVTKNGGREIEELRYGNQYYTAPTFQWKKIFALGHNLDGEIIAVGKDTGIPYQFRIYHANSASHDPTGTYELPHPNEYGYPPKMWSDGNFVLVYDIEDEDKPGNIYYTISYDGGKNWHDHRFSTLNGTETLNDIHFINENDGWIAGQEGNSAIILKTNDGGISWEKINLSEQLPFSSCFFTDPDEGYATIGVNTTEAEAKLMHTMDGGYSWEPVIETVGTQKLNKVKFYGEYDGIVCGDGPHIYRYSVGQ